MKRSECERIRICHALDRARATLNAIDIALRVDAPVGIDLAQQVVAMGTDIGLLLAKLDAYQRAEDDAKTAARAGGA